MSLLEIEFELSIYKIAQLWEEETGVSRLKWLHVMADDAWTFQTWGTALIEIGALSNDEQYLIADLCENLLADEPHQDLGYQLRNIKIRRRDFFEWIQGREDITPPQFWGKVPFDLRKSKVMPSELLENNEKVVENFDKDALGREILREVSKKATDARYGKQRELLARAANVAKKLWEGGERLLHHEMKKYLIEEYQDDAGKYPFLNLPEKSLLKTVKQVAKEMNRPDLISGQKKSK